MVVVDDIFGKLTFLQLKMDGWKMFVSFLGGSKEAWEETWEESWNEEETWNEEWSSDQVET